MNFFSKQLFNQLRKTDFIPGLGCLEDSVAMMLFPVILVWMLTLESLSKNFWLCADTRHFAVLLQQVACNHQNLLQNHKNKNQLKLNIGK